MLQLPLEEQLQLIFPCNCMGGSKRACLVGSARSNLEQLERSQSSRTAWTLAKEHGGLQWGWRSFKELVLVPCFFFRAEQLGQSWGNRAA